jgi:Peptidase S46
MRRSILVAMALLCLAGATSVALADEGMWLFNIPPTQQVKAKYGFQLTKPWLDHVRLSSVRFNNGGSGSFVSPDGLTFTNHHVGATCIHELSTGGKDYMQTGFYARTQAEEAKCPDLELNELLDIQDVTVKVNANVKPGMSVAEQAQVQRAAMSSLEEACATSADIRCDVMTLYSGAMYHLYKYKKYTDVRLVFAPEYESAFFGGDPDNFEFPRYDLDITFFRVYENGHPAHLENYFKWSTRGVKQGDLIFVSGNPGSTGRLDTMAQLEFLRDTAYPLVLESLERRAMVLRQFSAKSEENARIAQEDLFGIDNSVKAIKGYDSGLLDRALIAKKESEEATLKQALAKDPQKQAEYGDPFAEITQAMSVEKDIYLPLTYFERMGGFRSDLAEIARLLVRAAAERAKPNGERLREYSEARLPSLQQGLFSSAPIYKSLDRLMLGDSLQEMKERMPDDPLVKEIIDGNSPTDLAESLISGTRLDEVAYRK